MNRHWLLVATTLVLVTAACSSAARSSATAEIRVSGEMPGVEGAVIFLHVDDEDVQLDWASRSLTIDSGAHSIAVFIASCVGICDNLDRPVEHCRADVDVPPDGLVNIDIVGRNLAPGTTCAISAVTRED